MAAPRSDRCQLCGERTQRWQYLSNLRVCDPCEQWIARLGDPDEPRPPMWDLWTQDKPPAAMRQRKTVTPDA